MKKLIKVIKASLNVLMTLVLIVGIIFVILYVAGIEPYVVISGSMEPDIKMGSLCFVNKHAKYSDVKVEDVIAYTASTGNKVTHRVVSITSEGIETKGDRNSASDGISTTEENFVGKNIFSIPKLGYLVKLMQTLRGKIITITLAIFLFVLAIFIDDGKGKKVKKN